MKEHKLIINCHTEGKKWVKPYMVNSQGQYLDAVCNIGVNLPSFVLREVWFLQATLFKLPFQHLPQGGKRKGKDNLYGVTEGRVMVLVESREN